MSPNSVKFNCVPRAVSSMLFALGLWGVAGSQPAWAQGPPQQLNENCVVSVLNRNTRVKPDGSWVLPNIPANFGQVRARATCLFGGVTVSGESAPFLVLANGSVNVPRIVLGPTTPIPTALALSAPTTQLTQTGATTQLAVTASYSDGTTRNVTAAAAGTTYIISNQAIATVTADGLVTGLASGTVLIQAVNEGTAGLISVRVVLSADSDADGIPDDIELQLGLNPNNAADAFEDADRDGLNNRDEVARGTGVRDADSDDDGISDGEEVQTGADGFITNPLLADTDGDGVRDALEISTGSDPTNRNSINLAGALQSLQIAPSSFTLTVNSVIGVAYTQLTVTGQLRDGTTIDLTSTTRGTNYTSSDLNVCNFGQPDGRVYGSSTGPCTVTATNSGLSASAVGSVTNFSPRSLGSVSIPGYANNVDANGNFAYVAAGASGLVVVSVSNPATPVVIASLDTPGNANDVRVVGNLAYVADGSAGLRIIDVTNPAAPVLVSALDTPGEANDVFVVGSFAYVADGVAGLQIINVANPAAPTLSGTVDTPGTARGVEANGSIAVVADDLPAAGLRVVNVLNPATASIVGNLSLAGQPIDVSLGGTFAYVAAYTGGVHVVDVSSSTAPTLVGGLPGSAPNGFVPRDVQVAGQFALFAEQLFANAVAPIVDISVPASPVLRGVVDFGQDYAGTGVAVSGPFVYWTGQSFVVSAENGTTGTTRLFVGQYLIQEDRGGVAPTVSITSPADGTSVIEGTPLPVRVTATDDVAVSQVTFLVDGAPRFVDTSEPYEFVLAVPTGATTVTVGAQAVDLGGNVGTAPPITLTVTPDPLTTVVGRVIDPDGNPVASATVTAQGQQTTTGGDGRFTLPALRTVVGNIVAQATAVDVGGRTLRGQSAPLVPAPGGTVDAGDIRLRRGGPIALIHCDSTGNIRNALIAVGLFTAADMTDISACGTPPTLETLSAFSAVLVWSNSSFSQPDLLGNVLADYVDQGGGVVLATYVFSQPWRIGGRIATTPYSPFEVSSARFTTSGRLDIAGSNTSHPIMLGVTASAQAYFTNSNFTNPALTAGATLIARDTAGNNVVAVNATNRVVGVSIFPGFAVPPEIGRLFSNALDFVR